MSDHNHIYTHQAELYEALISKQPSLLEIINDIRTVEGLDAVDIGAGTGRLAGVLAPHVHSLTALDASAPMLELTAQKLAESELARNRWSCLVADNRSLPLNDQSADLLVSGWSVCYLASSNAPDWEASLSNVLAEFRRVLRPGGTLILFETMGTGVDAPCPPSFLTGYYELLTRQYGFSHMTFPLDYTFTDWRQAEACVRPFFGDELANRIRRERNPVVREFAGVWWQNLSLVNS